MIVIIIILFDLNCNYLAKSSLDIRERMLLIISWGHISLLKKLSIDTRFAGFTSTGTAIAGPVYKMINTNNIFRINL